LHTAAAKVDVLTSAKLINRGATLTVRNDVGQDPVETITLYEKRKYYINKMLGYSEKMAQKEVQILKRHKFQLGYILSLYEIIEGTRDRTNFEYFRKGYVEGDTKQERIDQDIKKELEGFCLNFNPIEEFYDPSKAEVVERSKRMQLYGGITNELKATGFGQTTTTIGGAPTYEIPAFLQTENIPSPSKIQPQPGRFKLDYSSFVTQKPPRSDSGTEVQILQTGQDVPEREAVPLYDLDPSKSVITFNPSLNLTETSHRLNKMKQT